MSDTSAHSHGSALMQVELILHLSLGSALVLEEVKLVLHLLDQDLLHLV